MTTAADDSAVEDAFEALLVGRPVPEGAAGLAAFTEAVRTSATRPGRPNAALAELLATGLLTDQSSPSVRTARSAGSAPVRQPSRVRTRRRTTVILSALLAKFLSAGAVAQAATGATVAVVAFTGVGVAGALPDPVQDTFTAAVATVTMTETPGDEEQEADGTTEAPAAEENLAGGDVAEEVGTSEGGTETPGAEPVDPVKAWIEAGPTGADSFGAWVSASANDVRLRAQLKASGVSFGSVISQWAKNKGMDDAELVAEGVDLPALTDEDTTEPETPVVVTEPHTAETGTVTQDRGSRGNGKAGNPTSNGNGNGNGNGKGAGNGNAPGKGNGKN